MSTQYVITQSHYLDHFPICQEVNGVSKESTCADNMELQTARRSQKIAQAAIKLMSQKW